MKVYLSGAMTGIPKWNFPAFNAAEKDLRKRGYKVFNPASGGIGEWHKLLKRDVAKVMRSQAVVVLPGWEKSKGARLEVFVGKEFGIPVLKYGKELQEIQRSELRKVYAKYDR